MATTQHRPHGAFAGPLYGTLDGKTEDTTPAVVVVLTQHRPHGAIAGPRYGTLEGKTPAGGAAPSAPTTVAGSATGSTTITATWIDASGDETGFRVQVRTAAGPGAWGDAAGATNPTAAGVQSFTITSLTAATAYDIQVRAENGSGNSAYVQSAASVATDNPGGGGGEIPQILDGATLGAVAAGGTLVGNPAAFTAGATLGAVSAGGALGPGSAFASGATLAALVAGGTLVSNQATFGAGATLGAVLAGGSLSSNAAAFTVGATLAAAVAGGTLIGRDVNMQASAPPTGRRLQAGGRPAQLGSAARGPTRNSTP